jgi:hypothetical protein
MFQRLFLSSNKWHDCLLYLYPRLALGAPCSCLQSKPIGTVGGVRWSVAPVITKSGLSGLLAVIDHSLHCCLMTWLCQSVLVAGLQDWLSVNPMSVTSWLPTVPIGSLMDKDTGPSYRYSGQSCHHLSYQPWRWWQRQSLKCWIVTPYIVADHPRKLHCIKPYPKAHQFSSSVSVYPF